MIRKSLLLIILFFILVCCKEKQNICESFISDLNNYDVQNTQNYLDDNFEIYMTYPSAKISKNQFLKFLIPLNESVKQKYYVYGQKENQFNTELYVKDSSIYERYLKLDAFKLKIILEINKEEKIKKIIFDTIPGHKKKYLERMEKVTEFENWISKTYPNENIAEILFDSNKLEKYLMKYAKKIN